MHVANVNDGYSQNSHFDCPLSKSPLPPTPCDMPSSTATRRSTSADDKLCPHQNVPLSIIEQEDPDFFKAISSSPLQRIPPPRDIGDQREMRQRVQDIHLRIPREPMSKRIFPPVWISVEDIPIVHGNSHAFSVRVYDPAVRSPDNQSLRPALIMYHGGGWTHGLPEMDEGMFTSISQVPTSRGQRSRNSSPLSCGPSL